MVIFILGAVYIGLSFLLTAENADGLLSGYNTLSDERKKLYDIKAVVRCINLTARYTGIAILLLGLLSWVIDLPKSFSIIIALLSTIPLMATNIYARLKHSTDPIRTYEWVVYSIICIGMLALALVPILMPEK